MVDMERGTGCFSKCVGGEYSWHFQITGEDNDICIERRHSALSCMSVDDFE